VRVRPAGPDDDEALARIDLDTWSESVTPAPRPAPGERFFTTAGSHGEFLVADVDGAIAGYIRLLPETPLAASAHVLRIRGLAVSTQHQGDGVGRHLVEAAVLHARARGARRLTLRVLSTNQGARRLYARCGFVVEGVQRELFLLGGRYVDDYLMALELTGSP
jgi:ribosomal protein S18 acetylase RimI-like enzyme